MADTPNKLLALPANGSNVNTWDVPVNANFSSIDEAFGGVTSLNATSGSATLTSSQYRPLIINVSGAISAPITYTIPSAVGGNWIVRNTTTDVGGSGGPHAIIFASGGGGTTVSVPRNAPTLIYSDGTNIRLSYIVSADGIAADAVTTVKIDDEAVTYPKVAPAALATANDFRSDTASKILPVEAVWDAAAYIEPAFASSVALDFSTGFNFKIVLTGNLTLANPTNVKQGQSGIIILQQDATGGRTTTLGSNFKTANAIAPNFVTTSNAVNVISYTVVSSTFIVISVLPGVG